MFSGGRPAFWTLNGALAMPRKPGPMRWAVPPTPMKPGNGRSFGVNSDAAIEPIAGYGTTGLGCPAGIHQHGAALVAAFVGDERADERQVLELRRDGRQDLADLDAVDRGLDRLELAAGRLAGLEVPEVHVAGAAAHPEDDEALVVLLQLGGRRAQALEEVQARNSNGRRARDVLEEVPPIHLETPLVGLRLARFVVLVLSDRSSRSRGHHGVCY